MAHTKAAGATRLGRDSRSKRLGVKKFGGQSVLAGNIIVRQKGTKYTPGRNTRLGNDYTIYATAEGQVKFQRKKISRFTGKLATKTFVHVHSK